KRFSVTPLGFNIQEDPIIKQENIRPLIPDKIEEITHRTAQNLTVNQIQKNSSDISSFNDISTEKDSKDSTQVSKDSQLNTEASISLELQSITNYDVVDTLMKNRTANNRQINSSNKTSRKESPDSLSIDKEEKLMQVSDTNYSRLENDNTEIKRENDTKEDFDNQNDSIKKIVPDSSIQKNSSKVNDSLITFNI
ncbi:MAG: hypothetical protein MHPSP_002863, partial [Paramarteilia canceri]